MRNTTKAGLRLSLFALPAILFLGCGDDGESSGDGKGGSAGAGAGTAGSGGSNGGSSGKGGSSGAATGGSAGTPSSGGSGGSNGGSSGQGGSSGAATGGSAGRGGSGGSGSVPPTGPDCTQTFETGATVAAIESAINSAMGGNVLCIPRGATFSGSMEISNASPTEASRVLVCAAAPGGTECSAEGGANPTFSSGITFNASSDGFVFRNLDFVCEGNCADATAVDFAGANHIRFEGGLISGWDQAFMCNSFSTSAPCDGIEIGALGSPTELTENTNGFFGWLSNSFVRVNAHDNGDGTVFTHHWYLSSGPENTPSSNVVFEGGTYGPSSVSGGTSLGTFLNFSGQNQDIVIRNNVFEDDSCGTYMIDCGSGGEDPEEFCDGMEIYSNTFRTNCPLIMSLVSTQRARIFNNVFVANGQIMSLDDGERPAADGWFFNNTVVCPADCEQGFSFTGDANRFFNNLLSYPTNGSIVGNGTCARFGGGNGPNFKNNFLYAPGSSPRLPSCGTANSTSFAAEPGFADEDNGDFHISASSPAAGFGTAENAPADDFDAAARPSPPAAGAFDVR